MGQLGLTGTQLATFRGDIFATGLDLGNFKCDFIPGVFQASSAATIRAGQMVSMNSSGQLVLATGADVIGVAKWNQMTLGQAVNVDEQITAVTSVAVNLKRANVSNVAVRSAAGQTGTLFTAGGVDYTLNTTNGTITAIMGGAITNGQTLFVTYSFALTNADYQFQGKNFFNSLDDVFQAAGRLAVCMGPAILFTTEYDTSKTYALTGASSDLFCTSGGQFSNTNSGDYVGKVIQLPSASYPFLGIKLRADTVQE